MTSEFLEFVTAIRALNIENEVGAGHLFLWRNNNQNEGLLPLIANLNIAQARVCLLFGSNPRVIEEVSRMHLSQSSLEILASLEDHEITFESVRIIASLNSYQAFVCCIFKINTIANILALSFIDITDDHVLSYELLSYEEQTLSNLRFILSCNRAYIRAFVSLPEIERSLEILYDISEYDSKIIEVFLNFPEDQHNISLLNKIAELSKERIELLEQVWDIDINGFNIVVEAFSDDDVLFCLSLSECDSYTILNLGRLGARERQVILSLEKKYRVSRVVNDVLDYSQERIDVWLALASEHHTGENFMQLYEMTEEQISLCNSVLDKDGVLPIDLFNTAVSVTDRQIDVFNNLYCRDQTAENLLKILDLSSEKLDLCWSVLLFEIEDIETISCISDGKFKVLQNLDDTSVEMLKRIRTFEEEKVSLCIWAIEEGIFNDDTLILIMSLALERIRAFLSLPMLCRTLATLNDFELLTKSRFNLLVKIGINIENLSFVFTLNNKEVKEALKNVVVTKESSLRIANNQGEGSIGVLRLEESPRNKIHDIQRDRNVAANIFVEAFLTTIICRDIAPQFSNISSYNYSKVVCNIAPVVSKLVATHELTVFIYQALSYGFPKNYGDTVNFSKKYMVTYTLPKVLSCLCSTKFSYGIAILTALGSTLYMSNNVDSKSITEIWSDTIKYNSSPIAIGMFSISIAQAASFAFLPSFAIGGAAALATDYLWTAYEEGSLQVLPSSLDLAYDAIFS